MIALGVLWGLQFPIVKNIWTSSYVLVCGGLSGLLLGVFHQVIDAWGRRSWATIFIWIGASAITLYLINGIRTCPGPSKMTRDQMERAPLTGIDRPLGS